MKRLARGVCKEGCYEVIVEDWRHKKTISSFTRMWLVYYRRTLKPKQLNFLSLIRWRKFHYLGGMSQDERINMAFGSSIILMTNYQRLKRTVFLDGLTWVEPNI